MIYKKKNCFITIILSLVFISTAIAKTPQNYKTELMQFNVILSANDEDQVLEWFLDSNSGFPDLADKLLDVLNNTSPKENSTVLDAIMGKYRIVMGKPASEYIPPPYDKDMVKKAFVKNWKERNSSKWTSLPEDVKKDLFKAFNYITNPSINW